MICKFCKEEIKDAAIKCKHCGSLLNDQKDENVIQEKPKEKSDIKYDSYNQIPFYRRNNFFFLSFLLLLPLGLLIILTGNVYYKKKEKIIKYSSLNKIVIVIFGVLYLFLVISNFSAINPFGSQQYDYNSVKNSYLKGLNETKQIGYIFSKVAGEKVIWEAQSIVKGQPYEKSHYLVEATWKTLKNQIFIVQFLVEKNGDNFFMHGATINGEFYSAEVVINFINDSYKLVTQPNSTKNSVQTILGRIVLMEKYMLESKEYGTVTLDYTENQMYMLRDVYDKTSYVTGYFKEQSSGIKVFDIREIEKPFKLKEPLRKYKGTIIGNIKKEVGDAVHYTLYTPDGEQYIIHWGNSEVFKQLDEFSQDPNNNIKITGEIIIEEDRKIIEIE